MAVTTNWRIEFMQAHARLFDVMSDKPERSFGYPFCEAGWRDVLEQLCTRIETALGHNETFKFVRIGQKLGLLRIGWEGEVSDDTKARINEAIHLAAVRSCRTCEICGLESPAI
jgi:hypothetical protein